MFHSNCEASQASVYQGRLSQSQLGTFSLVLWLLIFAWQTVTTSVRPVVYIFIKTQGECMCVGVLIDTEHVCARIGFVFEDTDKWPACQTLSVRSRSLGFCSRFCLLDVLISKNALVYNFCSTGNVYCGGAQWGIHLQTQFRVEIPLLGPQVQTSSVLTTVFVSSSSGTHITFPLQENERVPLLVSFT